MSLGSSIKDRACSLAGHMTLGSSIKDRACSLAGHMILGSSIRDRDCSLAGHMILGSSIRDRDCSKSSSGSSSRFSVTLGCSYNLIVKNKETGKYFVPQFGSFLQKKLWKNLQHLPEREF
jgi:hypothetical protein